MDVMLDIETLGTEPGCVVLAIGAVVFDPVNKDAKMASFCRNISLLDQLFRGLVIDPQALEWWKAQTDEAKARLIDDENLTTLALALGNLKAWLGSHAKQPGDTLMVWAKSPDFDCAILEHCAKCCGLEMPWTYRNKRDVRTATYMADLAGNPVPPYNVGVSHSALDDCYTQIKAVQHALGQG